MAHNNSGEPLDSDHSHVELASFPQVGPPPEPNVAKPEEAKLEVKERNYASQQLQGSEAQEYAKADIDRAELHAACNKVRKLVSLENLDPKDMVAEMAWPCCGLSTQADEFPLWCPIDELKELGPGIPMYYYTVKYLFWVIFGTFILAGIPCWASNYNASGGDEWYDDDADTGNMIIQSSAGNHGKDGQVPMFQGLLHVLAGIFIMISYYLFRNKLQTVALDIDKQVVSPSDYTIMVGGLGEKFDEKEVQQFFEEHGRSDEKHVDIIRTNVCYDIHDYIALLRDKQDVLVKLERLKEYEARNLEIPKDRRCLCFEGDEWNEKELQKRLEKVKKEIADYERAKPADRGEDIQAGKVFLTCKRQADVRAIDDFWGGDFITRMWNRIRYKCCKKKDGAAALEFNGRTIYARIAPEPSDIYWENANQKFSRRIWKIMATVLATGAIIGVCFGILIAISLEKDNLGSDEGEGVWELRFFSIFVACMISTVNNCIRIVIRLLTAKENHFSWTANNISVAYKQTFAMFLNSAILSLIVNSRNGSDKWFIDGGLVVDMFYITISISFIPPLFYLWDPFYIIRKCARRRVRNNEDKNVFLQIQIDWLFEGPKLDLPNRYTNVMKIFLVSLMYAPLIPVCLFIAPIGLLLSYLMDKYLLLNRHNRPDRVSKDVCDAMLLVIPYGVLAYAFMNWLVQNVLKTDSETLALVWMFIVLGLILLPITTMWRFCKGNDMDEIERAFSDEQCDPFENEAFAFVEDYDRSNPVTFQDGHLFWEKQLEEALKHTDPKIRHKAEQINTAKNQQQAIASSPLPNQPASRFGGMENYAANRVSANQATQLMQGSLSQTSRIVFTQQAQMRNAQYNPANNVRHIIANGQTVPIYATYNQRSWQPNYYQTTQQPLQYVTGQRYLHPSVPVPVPPTVPPPQTIYGNNPNVSYPQLPSQPVGSNPQVPPVQMTGQYQPVGTYPQSTGQYQPVVQQPGYNQYPAQNYNTAGPVQGYAGAPQPVVYGNAGPSYPNAQPTAPYNNQNVQPTAPPPPPPQ